MTKVLMLCVVLGCGSSPVVSDAGPADGAPSDGPAMDAMSEDVADSGGPLPVDKNGVCEITNDDGADAEIGGSACSPYTPDSQAWQWMDDAGFHSCNTDPCPSGAYCVVHNGLAPDGGFDLLTGHCL